MLQSGPQPVHELFRAILDVVLDEPGQTALVPFSHESLRDGNLDIRSARGQLFLERLENFLTQVAVFGADALPANRQLGVQLFQDQRVEVAVDDDAVIQQEQRRADLAGDHVLGMLEEIAVVRTETGVGQDEGQPALATRATCPLGIVGWRGRHVAHDEGHQVADVHAQFQRRGADQRVDLAGLELVLDGDALVVVELAAVLHRIEALRFAGAVNADVEVGLGIRRIGLWLPPATIAATDRIASPQSLQEIASTLATGGAAVALALGGHLDVLLGNLIGLGAQLAIAGQLADLLAVDVAARLEQFDQLIDELGDLFG